MVAKVSELAHFNHKPPVGQTSSSATSSGVYDNWLLSLALDLGERLMPAFSTKTGIPYGTVNLRKGVPSGETEISSTAGAGSLILEFEVLSRLVGDRSFGDAASNAAKVFSYFLCIKSHMKLCIIYIYIFFFNACESMDRGCIAEEAPLGSSGNTSISIPASGRNLCQALEVILILSMSIC